MDYVILILIYFGLHNLEVNLIQKILMDYVIHKLIMHLKKTFDYIMRKLILYLEKTFGLCNSETNHAYKKKFLNCII